MSATAPRRYTLDEIDRMRAAIGDIHLLGQKAPCICCHWAGPSPAPPGLIEERLRTALLAGIRPIDLEERLRTMQTEP